MEHYTASGRLWRGLHDSQRLRPRRRLLRGIPCWVTTEDHEEDWFIIASNPEEAARYDEDAEGYDIGEAMGESVLEIPENMSVEVQLRMMY